MPKPKSRGNGQGTAYKRGKTWEACVVVGWKVPADPTKKPYPDKRRKGGFPTKAAAIAACAPMKASGVSGRGQPVRMTLRSVYDAWRESYSPRVGASTMVCYESAYKHFAKLHDININLITARDLQECMDACPSGKRTHQNMKCVAGLLWAYAFDANLVDKDVTQNLYIGKGETKQRDPLTEQELDIIHAAIGKEPYAEYIYALCYLGFRPGEFLKLKKADLHNENGVQYLVGGGKTEAGRDRRVPIPQTIAGIIADRMTVQGTEYLFPRRTVNRKGEFTGFQPMSDAYFRESVFKPMMARLGIAEGKVPYSARHTYSDKLKNADGDEKAKASLMGHTDYAFTRSHYQSTDLSDLKTIADTIK